jgi:membrane-associated phospholipid phosphatase
MELVPFPPRRLASRLVLGLIGIALPLLVFLYIAATRAENALMSWDVSVLIFVREHTESGSSRRLLDAVRDIGGPTGQLIIAVLLLLIVMFALRATRDVIFVVVAILGAHILVSPVKQSYGTGFPSGHALGAMAIAAAAVVVAWRTHLRWPVAVAALAFIGLVGLSRLYYPAHYPSDVVGGWMLGLAWVLAARLAVSIGTTIFRILRQDRGGGSLGEPPASRTTGR